MGATQSPAGSVDEVRIRTATVADAEVLAELGARTFLAAFADHPQNRPEDIADYVASAYNPTRQTAELTDPKCVWLVAEVGDRVAGFALLKRSETESGVDGDHPIQVSRIYVDETLLGRRIGSRLLEQCLEVGRSGGHDVCWLGVWEHNHRAIAFYERFGFAEVGDMTFLLGSDPQRDVIMARRL